MVNSGSKFSKMTVAQAGLTEIVQGMINTLSELKNKEDSGNYNWYEMNESESLRLLVNAGFVNTLCGGWAISYCINEKGREFYRKYI